MTSARSTRDCVAFACSWNIVIDENVNLYSEWALVLFGIFSVVVISAIFVVLMFVVSHCFIRNPNHSKFSIEAEVEKQSTHSARLKNRIEKNAAKVP